MIPPLLQVRRAALALRGDLDVGQRVDAFFLDGAPDRTDRLLFQQKRAELGVTLRVREAGIADPDFELTVAAGYAWDGEFSVGFDTSNSTLLTDVSDTPYIRFSLSARFRPGEEFGGGVGPRRARRDTKRRRRVDARRFFSSSCPFVPLVDQSLRFVSPSRPRVRLPSPP